MGAVGVAGIGRVVMVRSMTGRVEVEVAVVVEGVMWVITGAMDGEGVITVAEVVVVVVVGVAEDVGVLVVECVIVVEKRDILLGSVLMHRTDLPTC